MGRVLASERRAVKMNLQPVTTSRQRPLTGDIFTMRLPGDRYLFGRVVNTEANPGWDNSRAILIYIYRLVANEPALPDPAELQPDRLLVAPIMTNKLPWSKGYFETVGHFELASGDVLRQHCFRSANGKYYDETSTELPAEVQPCGDWGLHSYRTIDEEVSDALGIPHSQGSTNL